MYNDHSSGDSRRGVQRGRPVVNMYGCVAGRAVAVGSIAAAVTTAVTFAETVEAAATAERAEQDDGHEHGEADRFGRMGADERENEIGKRHAATVAANLCRSVKVDSAAAAW